MTEIIPRNLQGDFSGSRTSRKDIIQRALNFPVELMCHFGLILELILMYSTRFRRINSQQEFRIIDECVDRLFTR